MSPFLKEQYIEPVKIGNKKCKTEKCKTEKRKLSEMNDKLKYDLQDRLIKFSGIIIKSFAVSSQNFALEHLLKQLIRSVTSAALNYGEAQGAESKKDFVHKMRLCLKELRESQVNLNIMKEANLVADTDRYHEIYEECSQLVAIFTSSLKTVSNNN